jgi:excisionase family DNA binding protein
MVEQLYMTTDEVAELCRTSAETVRYWRHVGKGPASFKLGRRVLYSRRDVDEFIAAARRKADTGAA